MTDDTALLQPRDYKKRQWVVFFEDAFFDPVFFGDDEEKAREYYDLKVQNWDVVLFCTASSRANPTTHKYDTSQYLDLEKEAQEMKAAKCQKCYDSGTVREDGVDGHTYACDLCGDSGRIGRPPDDFQDCYKCRDRANPTTPEREGALEALDKIELDALECLPFKYTHQNLSVQREDIKEYANIIRNALQSPARPVVKPLVWSALGSPEFNEWISGNGLGTYRIEFEYQVFKFYFNGACIDMKDTIEEAKSAAEAHWQAKIGECLV